MEVKKRFVQEVQTQGVAHGKGKRLSLQRFVGNHQFKQGFRVGDHHKYLRGAAQPVEHLRAQHHVGVGGFFKRVRTPKAVRIKDGLPRGKQLFQVVEKISGILLV